MRLGTDTVSARHLAGIQEVILMKAVKLVYEQIVCIVEHTLLLRQMSEDDSKRDKVKQKRVAEKGGTLKKGSLMETSTTWKVSEWQYPSTVLAENAAEMMQLEQFVYDKVCSQQLSSFLLQYFGCHL
jgi:hypothetical protein